MYAGNSYIGEKFNKERSYFAFYIIRTFALSKAIAIKGLTIDADVSSGLLITLAGSLRDQADPFSLILTQSPS